MSDLPFTIQVTPSARGMATFTALVGDKPVATERFVPGDGDKRRRVARLWADDDRLRNGRLLTPAKIAAALERIDNDDYGNCMSCEEPIHRKRLEFDPTATLCIECATKAEQ